LLDAAQEDRVVAAFGEATDEVKRGVNNTPCEIACDRTEEHRAHFLLPCTGHADRAGEGEHHDEAEGDLGEALNRIENAVLAESQIHAPDAELW
jgi:hypothetical protein